MPIYEYECEECREILEVSQSISEAPKTTCPSCSGSLKKLISVSSFQLKGSGWYSDGYNGPSNAKSDSKKSSSSPTKPTKKSPPKPTCPKSNESSCPCHT